MNGQSDNPPMPEPYAHAAQALRDATEITITTHINPDGDGIGAGLALLHAFERLGKRVRFLCPSRLASLYAYLPGFARIEPVVDEAAAKAQAPADVVISCDCGDRKRLGAVMAVPRRLLINLDHHATNDRFGDINLVDVVAESSGVVVSNLLRELGVALDPVLATCLYTTIVFDTGRFMHSNTTAHTFRWTADLLDTGIDAAEINRKLTYTRTAHDLAVLRLGLEHIVVDAVEPRLAGMAISAAAIAAVGEPEDWGDLVDVPRSLAGNCIAYLLRESPDGRSVRCSLRSNPPWEVSPVAEAFGGGGHKQAAGCTFPGSLAEAQREVVARLRGQF
jgi:bifunctional oligoribonuclease and PAP phosphatase NrnA